jgi:hypothetical protein
MDKLGQEDFQQIIKLIDTIAQQRGISKQQAFTHLEENLNELIGDPDNQSLEIKHIKTLLDVPQSPDILRLMVPDPTDIPPPPPRKKIGFKNENRELDEDEEATA